MKTQEEVIYNRFDYVLGYWIALHDQEAYFPSYQNIPQASVTYERMQIRANEAFYKLPMDMKECLVAHEVGHMAMGHGRISEVDRMLQHIQRTTSYITGHVSVKEIEADRYAAKLVGYDRMIKTMQKLLQILVQENAPHASIWETKERIKVLQQASLS